MPTRASCTPRHGPDTSPLILATARPPVLVEGPLDLGTAARRANQAEHEVALVLTLLLADQSAAARDTAQALQALDTAVALTGSIPPGARVDRRAARPNHDDRRVYG